MNSFTFRLCVRLIKNLRTTGLQEKIDVFYAQGRLSDEEYTELCKMLKEYSQPEVTI